jgi:hypothetical protein
MLFSNVTTETYAVYPVWRIRTIFDQIRIRLWKTSGPDPYLDKASAKFLLDIFFWLQYAVNKYIHELATTTISSHKCYQ